MKRLLLSITAFAASLALMLVTVFGTPVYAACSGGDANAQAKCQVCEGAGLTSCTDTTQGPSVDTVIRNVVNLLSFVVGVVAVIMMIIGGLKYITSSGDTSNLSSAKNTILYAVIGLVFVALAQTIVFFTIGRATQAPK